MSVRAVGLFMVLILLICVACSGCAAQHAGDIGISFAMWTAFCGVFACASIAWVVGGRTFQIIFLLGALVLAIGGCAALPMPLQPANEQYNSSYAEGAFLVLESVDTAQTMHIRQGTSCDHESDPIAAKIYGSPHPKAGRVLVTNLVLMTVHTMATSWMDDEVAKHDQANDSSVGPWYVGRVVWHAASILAAGSSVINNRDRGCAL